MFLLTSSAEMPFVPTFSDVNLVFIVVFNAVKLFLSALNKFSSVFFETSSTDKELDVAERKFKLTFAATSRAMSLFLSKITDISAMFLLRSTDVSALLLASIDVNEGTLETSNDANALLTTLRSVRSGNAANVRDFSFPLGAYTLVNNGRFERLKLVIGLPWKLTSARTGWSERASAEILFDARFKISKRGTPVAENCVSLLFRRSRFDSNERLLMTIEDK